MKIKMDFVSNSSSTSFIYMGNGNLSKKVFFAAVGVAKDSPLIEIFDSLYYAITSAIDSGEKITSEAQLEQKVEYPDFTKEVIEKAKEALAQGKKVVIAGLNSDGDIAESFLCMEAFEILSADFYLSALDNYW